MVKTKRKLNLGDSAVWVEPVPPFLLPDATAIRLILRNGESKLELAGTKNNDDAIFTLSTTDSAKLAVGDWAMVLLLTTETERASMVIGTLKVMPDPLVSGSYQEKSEYQQLLEAAEKAYYTLSSSGGRVSSYTIGSRQITYSNLSELRQMIMDLKAKVFAENGADSDPRTTFVRFR